MNKKPGSVRDLIGDYVAEQCTVIIDSEAQLRASENVVHTTRVAVRRLRSTVRVFPDLFNASEAEHLEEELGQACSAKSGIWTSWTKGKPHYWPSCRLN